MITQFNISARYDDFNNIIEEEANLIGYTWNVDTRIKPHPNPDQFKL